MQLSIYGEIATAIFVGFVFKTLLPDACASSGNKWTRTTEPKSLCEVALFPDACASGGNKWTRTTDLTLIRRVL